MFWAGLQAASSMDLHYWKLTSSQWTLLVHDRTAVGESTRGGTGSTFGMLLNTGRGFCCGAGSVVEVARLEDAGYRAAMGSRGIAVSPCDATERARLDQLGQEQGAPVLDRSGAPAAVANRQGASVFFNGQLIDILTDSNHSDFDKPAASGGPDAPRGTFAGWEVASMVPGTMRVYFAAADGTGTPTMLDVTATVNPDGNPNAIQLGTPKALAEAAKTAQEKNRILHFDWLSDPAYRTRLIGQGFVVIPAATRELEVLGQSGVGASLEQLLTRFSMESRKLLIQPYQEDLLMPRTVSGEVVMDGKTLGTSASLPAEVDPQSISIAQQRTREIEQKLSELLPDVAQAEATRDALEVSPDPAIRPQLFAAEDKATGLREWFESLLTRRRLFRPIADMPKLEARIDSDAAYQSFIAESVALHQKLDQRVSGLDPGYPSLQANLQREIDLNTSQILALEQSEAASFAIPEARYLLVDSQKPLTVSFSNAPVRQIVEQLCHLAKVLCEVGPNVCGTTSVEFHSVTLSEALALLSQRFGLVVTCEQGVIKIGPRSGGG